MSKPLSFQQVILRLQQFWAEHGCLIWQPYSEKVGAGTMNPATVLRVLGPEPWNVAYVEPSYRPDDGRFAENPNRMQMHHQFQVVLKPDPGNPQELYLGSLEALGIRREEHDIRFVEDNWESPVAGAWGLGWEVWLDGLEITQFTYFQQSGGFVLEPVSVELTYGLERIVMFLQDVRSVWEIDWDGVHSYGDVLRDAEVEHCRYDFEVANVQGLWQMYDLCEAEAQHCLAAGLVVPAHDYVLRCSHAFNVLDARGAVGVTERASLFRRMRDLSRQVAQDYIEQRKGLGYPWLRERSEPGEQIRDAEFETGSPADERAETFLFEVGVEELPSGDLLSALEQLREQTPLLFERLRLDCGRLQVQGTPRRLMVRVEEMGAQQRAVEELVKGPPARAAVDGEGNWTQAAQGFARKQGVALDDLRIEALDGGEYVVAMRRQAGRPTAQVLAEALPELLDGLRFGKSMRWNESGVAFSRPIRWLVALLGERELCFEYAGVRSGRSSRGARPEGSPELRLAAADGYLPLMAAQRIGVDLDERRVTVRTQVEALADSVGGRVPDDPALLDEVTNLVEQPTAFLGHFDPEYLRLPAAVLVAVMKKHQRYFPVYGPDGGLRPYFVGVRNGGGGHLEIVRRGNEEVIRARFADADYFFREDTAQPLEAFLSRLDTLTFQEQLGSMLNKSRRLEWLVFELGSRLDVAKDDLNVAVRAAHLCKADLATQMVVELTSLQGVMGREYALCSGEPVEVAQAIQEHYLPRSSGDALPQSRAGLLVGLADRLDSLTGLFAVGLAPSGSADPYGLRRDALGLVQLLIAAHIPFSVHEGLVTATVGLPIQVVPEVLAAAQEFVIGRLRVFLREQGARYDVVEAVLAARGDNPYLAQQGVEQLSRWTEREDWAKVLDNYARCVRITRDLAERLPLDAAHFAQPVEKELYTAYLRCRARVDRESSVDEFLTAFLPLVRVIDRYFARESGVLVMDEDVQLRQNRLAQLQHIAALAEGIVDLSRLEGF